MQRAEFKMLKFGNKYSTVTYIAKIIDSDTHIAC